MESMQPPLGCDPRNLASMAYVRLAGQEGPALPHVENSRRDDRAPAHNIAASTSDIAGIRYIA